MVHDQGVCNMKVEHGEDAVGHPGCQIRIGPSSWDKNVISIKFTWFDINGKACRGGEFPISALPQMVRMAEDHGYASFDVAQVNMRISSTPSCERQKTDAPDETTRLWLQRHLPEYIIR
jgi:hypothetical protein